MGIRNHEHKLVEPMIYQGTADSNTVYAYFETILPQLHNNSVIVLDNASYHKSQALKDLFTKHNCTLMFLPPYSPELSWRGFDLGDPSPTSHSIQ
jgi:transposase